jgi:hypothetical protein
MGAPIARSLLRARFEVRAVWNRRWATAAGSSSPITVSAATRDQKVA